MLSYSESMETFGPKILEGRMITDIKKVDDYYHFICDDGLIAYKYFRYKEDVKRLEPLVGRRILKVIPILEHEEDADDPEDWLGVHFVLPEETITINYTDFFRLGYLKVEPYRSISDLQGKTVTRININKSTADFYCSDGTAYEMYHEQDCCEKVYIEDVTGDINDLIGQEIIVAEERHNRDKHTKGGFDGYSETWTFYELRTIKGSVTIRWYVSSNGYYSERASFRRIY